MRALSNQMTSLFTLSQHPAAKSDPDAFAMIDFEAKRTDGDLRSSMLAWADEETLTALARWRKAVSMRTEEQRTLPPEKWTNLEEVYGDTVLQLRKSLLGVEDGWSIDKQVLLAALFNNRSLPESK